MTHVYLRIYHHPDANHTPFPVCLPYCVCSISYTEGLEILFFTIKTERCALENNKGSSEHFGFFSLMASEQHKIVPEVNKVSFTSFLLCDQKWNEISIPVNGAVFLSYHGYPSLSLCVCLLSRWAIQTINMSSSPHGTELKVKLSDVIVFKMEDFSLVKLLLSN